MKASRPLAMPWRGYIQKVFTLIEIVIVIVFAVIAFLLASTLPGLLRAPQTLADV